MKILIEWGRSTSTRTALCDVMAVDTSFGDRMTPLHKATAGGRYLAVQLLIDSLRSLPGPIPSTNFPPMSGSIPLQESLLPDGLAALDSLGRTPLDIAKANIKIQEKEQESVARWDQVSGYSADWTMCVQLLQAAEKEAAGACLVVPDTTTVTSSASRNQRVNPLQPLLPAHLVSVYACLGCEGGDGGVCLTASWESSFQAALRTSVLSSLQTPKVTSFHKLEEKFSNRGKGQQSVVPIEDDDQRSQGSGEPLTAFGGIARLPDSDSLGDPVGPRCAQCAKICFALHQGSGGQLVCKACKRHTNLLQ
jgi:hypothetical protein